MLQQFIKPFENILPNMPKALITFVFGIIAIKLTQIIVHQSLRVARVRRAIRHMIMSIFSIVVWVLLAVFVLKSLGFTGLAIALSGSIVIIGLAIANGSKEITADVIGGIFLSQDKDFNLDDEIKLKDLQGKIEDIDIRKTRIRDIDGVLHIVPNSFIEKNPWSLIKRGKK